MRKIRLAIALLLASIAASQHAFGMTVHMVTVYSQNGAYYLRSVPFDRQEPTLRGRTGVYRTGENKPVYEFDRGFDAVDGTSNNLILSDDGETIFYLMFWGADERREGMKSVTLYRHGRIHQSYTATQIDGCDRRRGRCALKYYNAEAVDQEKSRAAGMPYRKVLKDGVSDDERFLSDFAVFCSNDTVYLTDSNRRTHLFDLKEGRLASSGSFDDLYPTMKALARFTKVELEPYEVDGYQDFPRLRNGNDTSTELARYLGMKEIDFQQAGDPTQYKIYSVTVSAYLLRDGSLEVEGIDADEGLPKERIEAFFRNGKFQTRELPSVFEKFRVGTLDEGAIFYFRKSDKRLARRERETEREQEQRLELGASAVLDANRLVHMDEAGHIRVWRTNDGSFDPAATAEFARQDLVRIASDGAQLWALGTSQVYRWSPQDRSWKRAARFDLKRNPVKAFAVAGGAPFLILESGLVVNALAGRTYRTPAEDQFELMKMEAELEIAPDVDGSERKSYPERFMPFMPFGAPLRYTVSALGTDSRLWIGTSRGEWGGALYGLDPANGTWVDHGDSLAYVTGMTVDQSGQLIVSWSMNHMGSADTKILRHGPDAAPLRAISDSGARYYQTVAYNPFDNTLYGVEQGDVVAITNGGHTVLAELDGPIYGRERMAVGVAPGVRSLLPMASGAMAIVPKTGMPWLLRNGKLTRLQEPGSGN